MFNLINLSDAKSIIPVALVGLAGVAAYYLWTRAKANAAAAASADANLSYGASASSITNTGQLAGLALLSSLFGGGNTSSAPSNGQPTYTAPNTGSNAAPAVPTAAPLGSGSSTGNTAITQGV